LINIIKMLKKIKMNSEKNSSTMLLLILMTFSTLLKSPLLFTTPWEELKLMLTHKHLVKMEKFQGFMLQERLWELSTEKTD